MKKNWGCYAKLVRRGDPDKGEEDVWENVSPTQIPLQDEHGRDDYACPRQGLREQPLEWSRMLTYYRMYQKGHLPDRGATSDQSAFAMQVFGIFDDANADCDRMIEDKEAARRAAAEHRNQ